MEWQTQTIPHWKTNWASRRQIAAKLAVIDDRKLMSLHFLFRWFFFFNVGDVTHPCSSRSPLLCITGKIWGWSIRVQVTNQIIHPDSFFFFFSLPHSFTSITESRSSSGVWIRCVPLYRGQGEWKVCPGWRTATHIVGFYFLWKAHRRQCSLRHAACKELWHGVISAGHSPSADVGKESHSCRWSRVLCNSTRATVSCPADFASRGSLIIEMLHVLVYW